MVVRKIRVFQISWSRINYTTPHCNYTKMIKLNSDEGLLPKIRGTMSVILQGMLSYLRPLISKVGRSYSKITKSSFVERNAWGSN